MFPIVESRAASSPSIVPIIAAPGRIVATGIVMLDATRTQVGNASVVNAQSIALHTISGCMVYSSPDALESSGVVLRADAKLDLPGVSVVWVRALTLEENDRYNIVLNGDNIVLNGDNVVVYDVSTNSPQVSHIVRASS